MSQPFGGSLTEHAYYSIRDRILRGELPFGTSLSRRGLAQELNISIVPVGDALQRLENDGLVESRPRVGTRVRIPTAMAVRGHYIVREALESQAARIFAEKASAAERDEVQRLAGQLDTAYATVVPDKTSRERLFEIHEFHVRFHMRVAECTGCQELCQAIERNQILIFNWLYDSSLSNPQPPQDWHLELTTGLLSGDPDTADRAMRRHTRYRMNEVIESMNTAMNHGESRLAIAPPPRRRKKNETVERS